VVPVPGPLDADLGRAAQQTAATLLARGAIRASSTLVFVSVTPELLPGPSNLLKLMRV
jgi:hypothetical protein